MPEEPVEEPVGTGKWFGPIGDCSCECESCTKGPNSGTTCSLVVNGTTVDDIIWEVTACDDPFDLAFVLPNGYYRVTGSSAIIRQYVADLSALGNSFGCEAFYEETFGSGTIIAVNNDGDTVGSGSGDFVAQFRAAPPPGQGVFRCSFVVRSGMSGFPSSYTLLVSTESSIDICFEVPPTNFINSRGSTSTYKMSHGFDP